MERRPGVAPRETRPVPPRQVGCLLIRDPFVAVERLRNPYLATRVLAIGHPDRLAMVSTEARALGVEPGSTLPGLFARCPEAAVVPGQVEPYLDAAAQADEGLWHLGLVRAWDGLGECLFEPSAGGPAGGSVRRLAEHAMAEVFARAGLVASCGVADTIVAARAAASLAGPRGLVQVLPGCDARFLAPLDVVRLDGIDEATARRLADSGIATIGLLARQAPDDVRAVLGRAAGPLLQLARGHDTRLVCGRSTPARLVRADVLDCACRNEAGIAEVAARLAFDLRRVLDASGWRPEVVTLRRYGSETVASHRVALSAADGTRGLVRAVRALAGVRVGFEVVALSVVVARLVHCFDTRQRVVPAGGQRPGVGVLRSRRAV